MEGVHHSENGRAGTATVVGVHRTFTLSSRATAPRQARLELAALPGITGDVAYRVLLVTSEVVTACVERAIDMDEPIRVDTDIDDRCVRVTITASRRTPVHGHGRRMVERNADRWGSDFRTPETMWFEVDRRR